MFGVNNPVYDGFVAFNFISYLFIFYITSTLFAAIGFIASQQLLTAEIANSQSKVKRYQLIAANQWFAVVLFIFAIIYFGGYVQIGVYIAVVGILAVIAILIWIMLNELLIVKIEKSDELDNEMSAKICLELLLISLIAPVYIFYYLGKRLKSSAKKVCLKTLD